MIEERLAGIRSRLEQACDRAGREPAGVRILAVSKGHPAESIREAWACGLRDFGENYVQDWNDKADSPLLVGLEGLRWHFIGALQRNKVRFLLGRVQTIETIDRMRLAAEVGRRSTQRGSVQPVLLQVNLAGEESKSGFSAAELVGGLGQLLEVQGLDVRGLMAIPPQRTSPEATRQDHRELAALRERLQQDWSHPLPELSMGMTSDFEVAIEEGSTEIRLGTALFGARPARG